MNTNVIGRVVRIGLGLILVAVGSVALLITLAISMEPERLAWIVRQVVDVVPADWLQWAASIVEDPAASLETHAGPVFLVMLACHLQVSKRSRDRSS